MMPIIIPKLHLFQVQRELLLRDAMKLDNPLLSIAPKPFKSINIDSPRRKTPLMVHSQMPITTKHQRIITSKLVRIHNGPSSHLLDGHVEQRLCRHVLHHLDSHRPISPVDAENRDFPGCPSASLPFASSSKVGFIQFNLSFKKSSFLITGQNGHPKNRDCSENGGITDPNLLGDLSRRELDFKKLDKPKPFLAGDTKQVNPSIREIMEGVFAPFTPVSFACNSIVFSTPTTCTKNEPIFPTRFFEKQPSSVFRFCNKFKGFEFH